MDQSVTVPIALITAAPLVVAAFTAAYLIFLNFRGGPKK